MRGMSGTETSSSSSYRLPAGCRWRVRREKRNGRRTGRVVAQLYERFRPAGEPVEVPGRMYSADELRVGGGEFVPSSGPYAGRTIAGGMRGNALRELAHILEREGPAAFPPVPASERAPSVPGLRFGPKEDGFEWWFVPILLNGKRIGGLERGQEPGAEWTGVDCDDSGYPALRHIDETRLEEAKRQARRIIAAGPDAA